MTLILTLLLATALFALALCFWYLQRTRRVLRYADTAVRLLHSQLYRFLLAPSTTAAVNRRRLVWRGPGRTLTNIVADILRDDANEGKNVRITVEVLDA